ncbi:MAG TPA: glycoside hydrolase family 9 protein, partial [Candidatus Goldiibacteriota bacterium]|nr:glycoside hydrolase family 9 protein [Candidatus Goldiibacteriota bacterium]
MNLKKVLILFLTFSLTLIPIIKSADSDIRINSIGFIPNGVKGFTCARSASTFEVRNASTGSTVYTGNLGSAINATDSGETVYKGDFSSFTTAGTYYVNVPGIGRSVNFIISDDVFNNPFIVAMRAMYLWRCNTAVSLTYNGDTFSHAACHMNDAYLDYVGGGHTIRDGKGGWHDAGDYNKYIVNAGITVGMMFMAWEHFPAIRDVSWGLPNTATGYPDYLKEMKWEIDWVLKMAYSDGSGKVSGKLSARTFCGFIMPEAETADRYFTDWGSAATADYVAMLAMAARIIRPYDQTYSDNCINAAWTAYNFLLANTANKNPDYSAFSTGGYGTTDSDDRLWAAAEMWATTGSTTAHQDFTTRANTYTDKTDIDFDWGNVKNLGMYTYLLCTRTGKVAAVYDDIKNDLLADANNLLTYRNNHGYGRMLGTNGTSYYWGCNGAVARQSMLLQIANMVSPNVEYVNACIDILGYLFGRNMHRRSYVTGLGTNPPMNPHDRRSGADGITNPWPGYLIGGSNGTNSGDPVLSAMQAGLPAAQYWVDNQESYASNEIAINWQGALIYALAGFYKVSGTPTWTPTITRTGTRTPTWTYTRTNTFTWTRTSTRTPTWTNSPSVSSSPTRTRTPTWTRTNTPLITNTQTGTRTGTPTMTRTQTGTSTGTRTGTPTMTRTQTGTQTRTATGTNTSLPTLTIT